MTGGGIAVKLTAYRECLSPALVLALGAGFYLSYGRKLGPRCQRVVLWIVTAMSAALWSLPYLLMLGQM